MAIVTDHPSRLTFIKRIEKTGRGWRSLYECSCGNTKITLERCVNKLQTRSCGCLQKETSKKNGQKIKHGDCFTPEYKAWNSARTRCFSVTNKNYDNYGGRGIGMCERWDTYTNFLQDMGRRPSADYSLDRIDVNGNYSPENCRWATRKEQAGNRRVHMINATELQILKDQLEQYRRLYGPLSNAE